MKKGILILILAFSFGCKKDAVQIRHQPELPVPDQWSASEVDDDEIRAEWWTAFEDERLDELVGKALEHNYDLQSAAARLTVAAMQAKIAGADLWPSISGGWRGSGQRQNFVGLPIPGAEGEVLSRTFTSSGISFDISWEADIWGKIRARKFASTKDFEAAAADLWGARLSLVAQTSKAWFAVLEAQQQVELAQTTVTSYSGTAERVRGRYERGVQSSLDLRLALSSLAGAEALLQQRKEQLDRLIRQLELLLGQYPAAAIQPTEALPTVPPTPPAGIPSELVSRRPDLIAAEKRMWAAGARWSEARKALYPSIGLTGSLGTSTSSYLDVFNGSFFVWSLAGNILQPIFQGGRLRAQIELQDANSRDVAAQWAGAVLRAFLEVESALAAEKFLVKQEVELADAATQSTASLKLAEDRYNMGLESFVTVLESQRRSLNAESQLLTVRRQRLDARVDLHLALGGGLQPEELKPKEEEAEKEKTS
ncbi:MAG TPA: efflux transporter outer membrane subunit [Acidobacteriota bacterium]|nr:efflux transporter outer membrane subunit [Acidobacteriota bacterium]